VIASFYFLTGLTGFTGYFVWITFRMKVIQHNLPAAEVFRAYA
jgi:hypothetical protein